MLKFHPQDAISTQLLKSLPKKLCAWIINMGATLEGQGSYGDLTWSVEPEVSALCIVSANFIVQWTGSFLDPESVTANEPWVENITADMNRFIEVERLIYDQLERMERDHVTK